MPRPCKVNMGDRFGRLVVVSNADAINGKRRFSCRCDCGNQAIIRMDGLIQGGSKSCGCLRSEVTIARHLTHGQRRTRLYRLWRNIKSRCLNPNFTDYPNWGGRGITICDEWMRFEPFYKWATSHGYRDNLTIERRNNNMGYSPDNCCWATAIQQARNKRNNRVLTYRGESKTLSAWSELVGIKAQVIGMRIDRLGWSVEKSLTTKARLLPQRKESHNGI